MKQIMFRSKNPFLQVYPLFDEFVDKVFQENIKPEKEACGNLEMDIIESEKGFQILANLPGVKKENIDLSINENHLLLKAEPETEKFEEKAIIHRRERLCGSYQRSIILPENADKEGIKAKMENGVLNLFIPKKEKQEKKSININ